MTIKVPLNRGVCLSGYRGFLDRDRWLARPLSVDLRALRRVEPTTADFAPLPIAYGSDLSLFLERIGNLAGSRSHAFCHRRPQQNPSRVVGYR